MIINDFSPFQGQHCETTATGTLLKHIGIELSESMLFGIGEGIGFIYWDMKNMDFPFIGGRVKTDALSMNIVNNLGLQIDVRETSSVKTAWENVKKFLDEGTPVGLKLDSYYLDYFTKKIHFAGHYVAMYGYDKDFAYLVDTMQQGSLVKAGLENLALARKEKGPMSSKNLSYTICGDKNIQGLKEIILPAVKRNAYDFLNPPIGNIGYRGIERASKEMKKWFTRSKNIKEDLTLTALLMERAGTGGAIFRNLYRDFLKESMSYIQSNNLKEAHEKFCEIAQLWTEVSRLINNAGETQDISHLTDASNIVLELSKKEKKAMELLLEI